GDDVSAWAPHVERELDTLQQLAERAPDPIVAALEAAAGRAVFPWPDAALRPLGCARSSALPDTERTAHQLAEAPQWSGCVQALTNHHRAAGPGRFARTFAFIWRDGALQPIDAPDPIRLDALTGYETQRAAVVRNAEKFVQGLPANNVLLYGDRGTGKSATVKALGWAFAAQGLRLVEVQKDDLEQLPAVLAQLPGAPLRFIIFVDDLSFGEGDERYKHLKALLEGSLSVRPANVLMMVTSNRRHLLPERHADRTEGRFGTAEDEVHAQDGIQEKLSLADRFGLNVVFPSPDQEMFLRIVTDLARRRGLALASEELHRRALQWTRRQRGRSARTAVQFIDDLEGELALAAALPN
ncbi:MAG TPA: ATP-binding protein, partial [Limnochordia bacterium]|nr:ATP-binding protein [Limnochordia bacterium]